MAWTQADHHTWKAIRLEEQTGPTDVCRRYRARQRTQTPVALTLLGKGAMPESHPLCLGMMGMHGAAAVNTAIQGTAADLIKKAMIVLARRLKEEGRRARMILQVHDELVLEAPEEEADAVSALVREVMEGAHPLAVPLLAEVRRGPNWLDLKDADGRSKE